MDGLDLPCARIVGRVHGDCYAGGLGLAVGVRHPGRGRSVDFSLSEARLGLLPATISPYVIRAMGEQASRRYFVTRRALRCRAATAMGLVHEACAAEAIDAKVQDLVATLVANGPMAARACKRLVQDMAGRPIDPDLRAETAAPHRRHPRQRRGPRGRAELPRQAQTRLADPRDAMTTSIDTAGLLAIAAALGWASGLRLYPVVFLTGLAGRLGWVDLPGDLHVLASSVMLGASGLHALPRILRRQDPRPRQRLGRDPHGRSAFLPARRWPAAVFGDDSSTWAMVAALMGGTLAASSHVAKAATRASANTSPEPFSNVAMSLLGDGAVPVMLWLSWVHPLVALVNARGGGRRLARRRLGALALHRPALMRRMRGVATSSRRSNPSSRTGERPCLPSRVTLVEVGPRDGLQNEAQPVPADVKIALVGASDGGVARRSRSTSFVTPKWVPQMADATEVMARIGRKPGVRIGADART